MLRHPLQPLPCRADKLLHGPGAVVIVYLVLHVLYDLVKLDLGLLSDLLHPVAAALPGWKLEPQSCETPVLQLAWSCPQTPAASCGATGLQCSHRYSGVDGLTSIHMRSLLGCRSDDLDDGCKNRQGCLPARVAKL